MGTPYRWLSAAVSPWQYPGSRTRSNCQSGDHSSLRSTQVVCIRAATVMGNTWTSKSTRSARFHLRCGLSDHCLGEPPRHDQDSFTSIHKEIVSGSRISRERPAKPAAQSPDLQFQFQVDTVSLGDLGPHDIDQLQHVG